MTLYRQYSSAVNLQSILTGLTPYLTIDVEQFFESFYDISTCNSQGLDNWGVILNRTRYYAAEQAGIFGFANGSSIPGEFPTNFYNAIFANPEGNFQPLTDTAYRALLQLVYSRNTCNMSTDAISIILNYYFQQQNSNYHVQVYQDGIMNLIYAFNFTLQAFERKFFSDRTILPVPAAVSYEIKENYVQPNNNNYFGFANESSTPGTFPTNFYNAIFAEEN